MNQTKTPAFIDRYVGCLLGGAVGDALGAPVEFWRRDKIVAKYGPRGITRYVERGLLTGRTQGRITDDTQMTLFTAEGLLDADATIDATDETIDAAAAIYAAYLRWYETQTTVPPTPAYLATCAGLQRLPQMWSLRAPGNTCLGGLREARARGRYGTFQLPLNSSMGCGAVMRVAPVGLFYPDAAQAFDVGAQTGVITHGHPNAWVSAGWFAALISLLARGYTLSDAIHDATRIMENQADADKTSALRTALNQAIFLATSAIPEEDAYRCIGEGWDAISATALAVYAAVRYDTSFSAAVICAVNHDGDSDTTGSLVGQIMGTHLGASAIPNKWLNIDLKPEIVKMAQAIADRVIQN